MRRFLIAFLCLVLLGAQLVGCGAIPDVTDPEMTEPEVATPEATTPEETVPEVTVPETTEPETTAPETTELETTEPEPEVKAPDAGTFEGMQSVLLLGQSNMSGRGLAGYVEPISDDRIFMQRGEEWVSMQEPIHYDSAYAGIGLAASFAKAFVETFDCELGLIPAAVGGSGVSRWKKSYTGEDGLYATAIERAKAAQKTSNICAILWHQGETNRNSTTYAKHFKEVIDPMIEDLGLDKNKLVIITGELGAWEDYQVDLVNSALAAIEEEGYYPNYGVASQEGLTNIERSQGSNHFDSPSLRVFGYRYFEAFYEELMGKECSYEYSQDPDDYRIDPAA
ncbi:MAG: hypothetical protein J6D16_01680 [Clostridia bacterium]|nr:hypothetical protein [Clostridia bacterium]